MKDLVKTLLVNKHVYQDINRNPVGLMWAEKSGVKYRVRLREIWRDIKGWKGYYQVSSFGRVKSMKRVIIRVDCQKMTLIERVLSPCLSGNRYWTVILQRQRKTFSFRLNRLVANSFIANPECYEQVNHKNAIKGMDDFWNLEWCSPRENISHGLRSKNTTSKYVGVTFYKERKKWRSQIKINKVNIALGDFNSEKMAAMACANFLIKNEITNRYQTKR